MLRLQYDGMQVNVASPFCIYLATDVYFPFQYAGTNLSSWACVHSFLSPSSSKSSLFSCSPHSALFSPVELLFELCLSLNYLFVFPTFFLLPSHLPLDPKQLSFFDSVPPVLESLTPLSTLLFLPRLPLNPIFHRWTTANFPPVLWTALSPLLEHA